MSLRLSLSLATACSVALLAACGAVGEGSKPETVAILPLNETEGAATTASYVCLPKALRLIATFTRGDKADFTGQATWSSSNSAVLRVSNGDISGTDGTVFGRGVLVSQAPGTAIITAKYIDFSASITVTVDTVRNLRIGPTSANMAPGSFQNFDLAGDLAGVPTALDIFPRWSFVSGVGSDSIATLDVANQGIVSAVAEGTRTLRASFTTCPTTVDANVAVSPLSSLRLDEEFAGGKLTQGTTMRLAATGTLANGQTQDLTGQVRMTSSDSNSILVLSAALPGLVSAGSAATTAATVTAKFGPTSSEVTSNTVALTPTSRTLDAISMSPTTLSRSPGNTGQLTVTGTYTDGSTQPITRHVTLESSNTAAAIVLGSDTRIISTTAGLVVVPGTATAGSTATITATNNSAATTKTATATVTVTAPASP